MLIADFHNNLASCIHICVDGLKFKHESMHTAISSNNTEGPYVPEPWDQGAAPLRNSEFCIICTLYAC